MFLLCSGVSGGCYSHDFSVSPHGHLHISRNEGRSFLKTLGNLASQEKSCLKNYPAMDNVVDGMDIECENRYYWNKFDEASLLNVMRDWLMTKIDPVYEAGRGNR